MAINIRLLHYELQQAGLPVVGVSSDGRIDYSRALTGPEQTTADGVVGAHNSESDLPRILNATAALQTFLDSSLVDLTPAEIYTLLQAEIDGWQNLTSAKVSLRQWLPLLFAIVAWRVLDQDN